MRFWRRLPRTLRGVLLGWVALQGLTAAVGWVLAWRRNVGDASSTSIRRTLTHGGLELHPTNPRLERIRVDLAMAGGEIDLTGITRPPHGVDLTARVMMAGLSVRIPP